MKPCFKAILKGYRRHIEVVAQTLKAEIALLFHVSNVAGAAKKLKGE